ncbi:proprotein convertase P-domain-containing protein [Membranihabitans marinus]|uniref:proprotein convertase P-domain-containing protein n=1 Tax=Membranihabitans marinus TaxID=1227546 RepID=UPI001F027ED1|nr:proprotein convertase P-domain-containing protein [Membranihabitans marinus]
MLRLISSITLVLCAHIFTFAQECKFTNKIAIPDNGSIQNIKIEADTRNAGSNILCGVTLNFEHDFIGDLFVELISPDGQRLTLIQSSASSANTDNSTWDITFVRDLASTAPDQFKLPEWGNNTWSKNQSYTGAYLPEDNNGLSVFDNSQLLGTWNLNIADSTEGGLGSLLSAALVFCNPTTNCAPCTTSSDLLNNTDLGSFCGGDPSLASIRPTILTANTTTDLEITYVVLDPSNNIVLEGQSLDFTSLPKGKYRIYAVQYRSENYPLIQTAVNWNILNNLLVGKSSKICGSISNQNYTIEILSDPFPIQASQKVFGRNYIDIDGQRITSDQLLIRDLLTSDGCDSTVHLDIQFLNYQTNFSQDKNYDCNNTSIELSVSNSENFPVHRWFTKTGYIDAQSDVFSNKITVVSPGEYFVVFEIEDYLDTVAYTLQSMADVPLFTLDNEYTICGNSFVEANIGSNYDGMPTVIPSDGVVITGNTIRFTTPRSYTIRLQKGSCSIDKTILVTRDNSLASVTIQGGLLLCEGSTTNLIPDLSEEYDNYRWILNGNVVSTSKTYSTDIIGDYLFEAYNDNSCGLQGNVTVLKSLDAGQITIQGPDLINCNNQSNDNYLYVNIDSDFSAVWTRPDGSQITNDSVLILGDGMYSVDISTPSGCNFTENKMVSTNLSTIDFTVPASLALNCSSPQTRITATGFTAANYSISWSGNGLTSSQNYIDVDKSGVYNVTVTHTDSKCRTNKSVSVTANTDKPIVDFSPSQASITCENIATGNNWPKIQANISQCANCSVSVLPGIDASWDDASQTIEVREPGQFTLQVTNTDINCVTEASYTVSADTTATPPNITIDHIGCGDTQGGFTISDAVDYSSLYLYDESNNPILSFPGNKLDTNQAAVFTLSYRQDQNSCANLIPIEILNTQNPPQPQYQPTAEIECSSGYATLIITEPTLTTIDWTFEGGNLPQKTKTIQVDKAGVYSFSAINDENCMVQGQITVIDGRQPPQITLLSEYELSCSNPSITINYTRPSSITQQTWLGPNGYLSTEQFPTLTTPGKYLVNIEDNKGCINTQEFFVTEQSFTLNPSIEFDTITCDINPSIAHLDSYNQIASVTWSDEGGRILTSDSFALYNTGRVSVYIEDINGCSQSTSIEVFNDLEKVNTSVTAATINCEMPNPVLTATVIGNPSRAVNHNWYFNGNLLSTSNNLTATDSGQYLLESYFDNGCRDSVYTFVNLDTVKPIISLPVDTISCLNSKIKMPIEIQKQNLRSASWTSDNGFTSTVFQPIFTEAGTYDLTYTAKNGCVGTATYQLFADLESPTIDSVGYLSLGCNGQTVPLGYYSSDSIVNQFWKDPNGIILPSQVTTIQAAGEYILYLEGPNGCAMIDTFDIVETIHPEVELEVEPANCRDNEGEALAVLEQPFFGVEWRSGGSNNVVGNNISIQNLAIGMHNVTVTNPINGCSTVVDFEILDASSQLGVSLMLDDSLRCEKNTANIISQMMTPSNHYTYQWTSVSDGSILATSPNLMVTGEGQYRLLVTDTSNFCTITEDYDVVRASSSLRSIVLNTTDPACFLGATGSVEILDVVGANNINQIQSRINNTEFAFGSYYSQLLPNQTYQLTVKDEYGCTISTNFSLQLVGLIERDRSLSDYDLIKGDTIDLNSHLYSVRTNLLESEISEKTWTIDGSTYSCDQGCEEPANIVLTNSSYVYTSASNEFGCTVRDTFHINVREGDLLDIPNALYLNSSSEDNRHACIYTNKYIETIHQFIVFERSGAIVFERKEFNPRASSNYVNCWSGLVESSQEPMPAGNYTYFVEYSTNTGERKEKFGSIFLIR